MGEMADRTSNVEPVRTSRTLADVWKLCDIWDARYNAALKRDQRG